MLDRRRGLLDTQVTVPQAADFYTFYNMFSAS